MTIRQRLSKLERMKPAQKADGDGRAKLLDYLNSIGTRLRMLGIVEDRPEASTAERLALAFERGDTEAGNAILSRAVGRKVQL